MSLLTVQSFMSMIESNDAGLTPLPDYSIKKLPGGTTFGISAFTEHFSNVSRLGFYVDAIDAAGSTPITAIRRVLKCRDQAL